MTEDTENEDEFRRAMEELGLPKRGASLNRPDELLPPGKDAGRGAPAIRSAPSVADADRALFLEAIAGLEPDLAGPKLPDRAEEPRAVPGLSRRRVHSRIAAGKIVAERTLDLHGKTRADALRELGLFLGAARADGIAVVKVVTGRGLHSRGDAVLPDAVLGALDTELRPQIVDLVRAPRTHGGEGAVFIFLRGA